MKLTIVLLMGVLLVAAILLAARAQNQTDPSAPTVINYRPGQVWTMGHGITITILAIEDVHKIGNVVHVRVDNIPWQRCGDVQLTRAIEHLAVAKEMMPKSGLVLSRDNVDLPESSIEAYRKWEGQKKHEVAKVPLQKAIFEDGAISGPMICNFVPSQT